MGLWGSGGRPAAAVFHAFPPPSVRARRPLLCAAAVFPSRLCRSDSPLRNPAPYPHPVGVPLFQTPTPVYSARRFLFFLAGGPGVCRDMVAAPFLLSRCVECRVAGGIGMRAHTLGLPWVQSRVLAGLVVLPYQANCKVSPSKSPGNVVARLEVVPANQTQGVQHFQPRIP